MINKDFIFKNKAFSVISIILSVLIIFIITKCFLSNAVIAYECLWAPFQSYSDIPENSFWQIFTTNDHSWYIYSIFDCLSIKYLPALFNMHPQMFINQIYTIFLAFIFILFLFTQAKNFTKYAKKYKYTHLVALLIFPVVLHLLDVSNFLMIFQKPNWLTGYIMLPIFGILTLGMIEKHYVDSEHFSKRNIFSLICLLLCVSISQEFYIFVITGTIILGAIFHKKHFKTVEKSALKYLYIFIGFVLFNAALFFNSTFQGLLAERYYQYSLSEFLQYCPVYLYNFVKYVFIKNWFLWIPVLILSFSIHSLIKDEERNTRLFIFTKSIIYSTLVFCFLMAFYKNYDIGADCILAHEGISFLVKTTLLCLNLSLLGYLFCHAKDKKTIFKYCGCVYFIFVAFFARKSFLEIEYIQDEFKTVRQNMYILEKFYLLNGKNNPNLYVYNDDYSFDKLASVYLTHIYKADLKPDDYKIQTVCSAEDEMNTCQTAMTDLIKEKTNYLFTEEELENLEFNKLYELNK